MITAIYWALVLLVLYGFGGILVGLCLPEGQEFIRKGWYVRQKRNTD